MTLEIIHTGRAYIVRDKAQRDFWFETCLAAEKALAAERALRQVAETSERATRKMLARQCDMARTAETEAMKAKRELTDADTAMDAVQSLWHSPAEAKRLRRQLGQAVVAQADAELAAHVLELREGLERQSVYVERARRQEAEQRAERAEALAASTREAAEWLWGFWDGNTLIAKPGYEDDIREAWDRLLAATDGAETVSLLGRLEEAEALAALVTPELANLLEVLGKDGWPGVTNKAGARRLAAQIREAL